MTKTKIPWTERTWNPMHGCVKWSEGCKNCYAEVMAKRLQGMGVPTYEEGFRPTINPNALDEPKRIKKPTMFFVCSMGDLFFNNIPFDYIDRVMKVIEECPQHTFQILTKRDLRMYDYFETHRHGNVPKNVWLGVSVENDLACARAITLGSIRHATVRFLSCEPLLGQLDWLRTILDNENIDWIICGGESGPKARPMSKEWVLHLIHLCDSKSIPFFFKQWGTWGEDGVKRNAKANGCSIDGQTYQSWPKGKPYRTFDSVCPIGKKGDKKCMECQFDGGLETLRPGSYIQMCAYPSGERGREYNS